MTIINTTAQVSQKLKELNATHYNKHIINNECFNTTFFNKDGLEIAHIIHKMFKLCGLAVINPPRRWSETLLYEKDHTPLTPLNNGFDNY